MAKKQMPPMKKGAPMKGGKKPMPMKKGRSSFTDKMEKRDGAV